MSVDALHSSLETTRPVRIHTALTLALGLAAACGGQEPGSDDATAVAGTQEAFWSGLESLCGESFAGRVTRSEPPDPAMDDAVLTMHVRECGTDEIKVPFFVGDDRSRTWIISRTSDGLRLKHDHRHEDGSEDEVTQYGGDTSGPGSASVQDFYADAFTANLVPTAANNIWSISVRPGTRFLYELRREGSERRFTAEFDLSRPIETPPPPWGG